MEGLLPPTQLIFIFGIVLLILGPKKLPDQGQGMGKGIREFKDAVRGAVDLKPAGEKLRGVLAATQSRNLRSAGIKSLAGDRRWRESANRVTPRKAPTL